ncbi:RagB/SusD family nutrient uptake outer membrane protein [Rapidithrix thailandica]|uniref:RagB/SusD family nutrient uptake outer membrane protein n=1 Tax=Rapidithrix thailandica TaxID=413964 RepID=A0AAW9RSU2_9BACT
MMKMKFYTLCLSVVAFLSVSCEDVLDKENLGAINPQDVWNDYFLAQAYVDNIYSKLMPEWSYSSGGASDEAPGDGFTLNDFLKGNATIDTEDIWHYSTIRKINILLQEVEKGSLKPDEIDKLKGQALFWRAWAYFDMVKRYGGVPLILQPQDREDEDAILVSRNKTSECILQMEEDLNHAIDLLPDSWNGVDYGRIDKGVAMAFKGRVLLYYASPQFTPNGDQARWQKAYEANKAAVDFLDGQGKGLFADFAEVWYEEQNKEAVMFHRYFHPGHTSNQNLLRPIWATRDNVGGDRPTIDLVNAFPMKDGSDFDPNGGYQDFWKNRDQRFYATVAYTGSDYGIPKLQPGGVNEGYLWNYKDANGNFIEYELYEEGGNNYTGFYRNKALDKTITPQTIDQCGIDWIEIRYAEVLMNYGEAANEIGKTDEALTVLYKIRERAGIEAGSGNYGIAESSKEALRERYMKERQVEFAFEGKRWWDLRRWRRFDVLNNLGRRHALFFQLKSNAVKPSGWDDLNAVGSLFDFIYTDVEQAAGEAFNLQEEYYFYGIPKKHLDVNSNLEQTQGWDGGTFDPLQ